MIVIRLQGGLGNQLFQYALYLELLSKGKKVFIDEVEGYVNDNKRRPVLRGLFGVDYKLSNGKQVNKLRDADMGLASRVKRKLFGRRSKEWVEKDGNFCPEIFTMKDAYLDGYFQSDKYFPDASVRDELRSEISANRLEMSNGARELMKLISHNGGASIHIRRGDYLLPDTAKTHGGICTEDYYERAIGRVLAESPDAEFWVFSDDKEYAADFSERASKKHGSRFTLVDTRTDDEDRRSAEELLLMSRCRDHVLANSSFSWWGAFLSMKRGLVVAPSRWYNNKVVEDIYTAEMVRI